MSSLSGRKENIAPDYPLTLLEGLTTITHYCLLDNKRVKEQMQHTHTRRQSAHLYYNLTLPSFSLRQTLVASDPVDVRNARNAVIEALPQMLSSMALLWGAVMREEIHRRANDSAQSYKHTSTSVYFKCTRVCFSFIIPQMSIVLCQACCMCF